MNPVGGAMPPYNPMGVLYPVASAGMMAQPQHHYHEPQPHYAEPIRRSFSNLYVDPQQQPHVPQPHGLGPGPPLHPQQPDEFYCK